MKIFSSITPFMSRNNACLTSSEDGYGKFAPGCDWIVWPDSCMIGSNRTIFIPDFDSGFFAVIALAGRIGSVGKTIAMRFAHRYIDSFSAALIILPAKSKESLLSGEIPAPADLCFDNAIIAGDRIPIDNISSDFRKDLRMTMSEFRTLSRKDEKSDSDLRRTCSVRLADLFPAIVEASQRNTLKSGDIVLYPIISTGFKPEENVNIKISFPELTDTPVLIAKFR